MLGEKIKEMREAKGLMQRQLAVRLKVDVAYVSKMESNEKPVSRNHLPALADLLAVSETELLKLWLANKVYGIVKGEELAMEAIEIVEREIITNQTSATGTK